MFSNFKNAFIKKPQFTIQPPKSVLDVLSKDLPEGFRYISDQEGFCRIDCGGVMNFGELRLQIPKDAQPLFAELEKVSMKDILVYAQNSQTNIEVLPDAEGCYTVNGKKIEADKFVIAPLKGYQLKNGRLYVMAPPFPDPFPIEVTGNGFSLKLMVQRQVINSIKTVKIGTVSKSALKVEYTVEQMTNTGKMNINITMCPSSSASDVLASKEIFNAFIQGEGTLCGVSINVNKDNTSNLVPDEVIRFWHQIVAVEKTLDVKFDVSKEITFDDIKKIKKLYRCLVEKAPFRTNLNDNTIQGVGEFDHSSIDIGQEVRFEYVETVQMDLFSTSIRYYKLVDVFDGMVGKIQAPEEGTRGKFFVKLYPAKNKKMYSATQYYLEKNLMEDCLKDPKHIEIFQSALEIEL